VVRNLAFFAVMSVIWGLTWAAIKFGLEVLPPMLLAALRYLLTTVLLVMTVRGARAAFSDGYAPRTVASALLVNTGTYGLLFWGMQSVSSGLSGLVNLALIPVMLVSLATLTGEEKPNWRYALALTIGCGGLVALFCTRLGQGGGSGTGLAAIIGGTACYCVGTIVARPLVDRVEPLTLTMVQAAIGGTALLLLSVTTEPIPTDLLRVLVEPRAIGSLAFLSLLGTIVAYTIYLALLRDWGTVRAGLYAFISPIVALAAGAWLFSEQIGAVEIVGAVLLLAAASLAMYQPQQTARP
jgi:drug/metabolite transporter (DMT)-like permease